MDKDILHDALKNFIQNSKFNLELKDWYTSNDKNKFDGKLKLQIDQIEYEFLFEIKQRLTLSNIPKLHYYFSGQNNVILISDYISKPVKNYLKDNKMSYIDMAGNAFIKNKEGLFLYIETNKNLKLSSEKSNRAFSKSGLKVIYQILVNEEIINMPYRQIGQVSKVSIDTVGKVFKELLRDKYLVQKREKEFKIQNKERLIQEWTTIFNRILRPKLKQRSFKPKGFEINDLLNFPFLNSIGGELAADFLSNYLIAESAIIYTDKPFIDLAKKIQLLPASNGPITMIEKFWKDDLISDTKITVNPILVYADLLSNPNPRNLETAQIIYNKDVKNIL